MDIEHDWKEFITNIASQMEQFDKEGAKIMLRDLLVETPPDKKSLVWSKAFVTFQHAAMTFIHVCINQDKVREAFAISRTLSGLNEVLCELKEEQPANEFCKHVQF